MLSITTGYSNGQLTISSDSASETIAITSENAGGTNWTRVNGQDIGVAASSVTRIDVYGGMGDDTIDLSSVSATAFGSLTTVNLSGDDGNDVLIGSQLNDTLAGGSGDDALSGGEGDDSLWAGAGNDALNGEDGNDMLLGQNGNDILRGGAGNNSLQGDDPWGATGDDVYVVEPSAGTFRYDWFADPSGIDTLDFSPFANNLTIDLNASYQVAAANEYLIAELSGTFENVIGGDGNDTITGNGADNTLHGGDGNDILHGGAGNDALYGDGGDDSFFGDAGNNTVGDYESDADSVDVSSIVPPASPYAVSIPAALEGKISPDLWAAVGAIDQDVTTGEFEIIPGGNDPAEIDLSNIASAHVNQAGAIHVYVRMNSFEESSLGAIDSLGLEIVSSDEFQGVIETWVPYGQVEDLASLEVVVEVKLPVYGRTNTGTVNSAGDGILNADDVRATLPAALGHLVNGTGVKIGVISDGVSHRSQVQSGGSPDLPTVTVNSARPGSGDEGTAMLEIVHDLAPGAALYFSSGIAGTLSMVDSINWLIGQGVDVIVDDLSFFGEHFFSDGSVALAAANAVSNGVAYVTSAGNYAQQHYQGQWSPSGGVHDFDATAGVDNVLDVGTVPNGGTIDIVLQWSDSWTGSSNDYNLGLYNLGTMTYVATSTSSQTGTQHPFEVIEWTNTTGAAVNVGVVIDDFNSPASRELELFVLPLNFGIANLTDNDRTTSDSIFGQAAVQSVLTVAAISASDPGNDTIESFSSQGNSTIYDNFTTQHKVQRQSLDGAGIDGVQTRIGQLGFFVNPFFGTSAAAPHAAAIAALLLDANPSLTPAQVSSALTSTSVDIGAAGYDVSSGFGRFDAFAAVKSVLWGDMNDDGWVDANDIDILWSVIRYSAGQSGTWPYHDDPNSNDSEDLNGDGFLNEDDVDYLLANLVYTQDHGHIANIQYGDADLDGGVGGLDYTAWRERAGTGWAHGDFDGDGGVGGLDYTLWRTRPTAYTGDPVGPH